MGFDEGRIILDSDNGIYYAGQMVYGKLVFDQDKVKTFRGIYVKMKGYCDVEWTTTHTRRVNDREETYTVDHMAHEVYFEQKQYLIGGETGELQLNAGRHEFPFQCQIPFNCPSSYEGSYGHIRYEFKVVVDRKFKIDQEKKAVVRVIAPYDLNMDPYCREPIQFEMHESYCCWCVSSGSSEIIVKLPVAGYCPGQMIPIELACTNNSNVEISKIKFSIIKNTIFRASDNETKHEDDKIAEIKKGPVAGNSTRTWTVDFEVPVIDAYNLTACRFIDIDYEFKVTVEPDGCHDNSEESTRIVIGTIPLVGFQDNFKNPLQDQMPNVPIPVPETHQTAPNYNSQFPIITNTNQPLNTGYPYPGNQPYPGVSPYPAPNPAYPGSNPSYPGPNPPYPGANPYPSNTPYPPGNPPNPVNPPYTGNSPYPPAVTPYPANPPQHPVNSPYPNPAPYPGGHSPNPPYPGNSPYPAGTNQPISSPYPGGFATPYSAKDIPLGDFHSPANVPISPTMGAKQENSKENSAAMPLLPEGAKVPYPTGGRASPYATASAPEPSTPDIDEKNPMMGEKNPPYNPEFIKNDK